MVKNGLDYGCTSLSFPVALAAIGVEVPLYHVQWGRAVIVMGDRLGMSSLGGFYVATAGAQQ